MTHLTKKMGCLMSCALISLTMHTAYSQSISQYILSSAGGSAMATGNNMLNFTVGEAIILTAGNNPVLSQGFNQPTLSGAPLPVQMNFSGSAERNYNLLVWTTFQEMNNSFFDLERSTDGVAFTKIANIPSKAPMGTSTSKIEYSFNDNTFVSSKNYYRLRQVDFNGRQTYSPVVMLQNVKTSALLSVSPNPALDRIAITVPESGVVSIVDINGKTVRTMDVGTVTSLDISGFSAGAYFINFKGGTTTGSLRFIKK